MLFKNRQKTHYNDTNKDRQSVPNSAHSITPPSKTNLQPRQKQPRNFNFCVQCEFSNSLLVGVLLLRGLGRGRLDRRGGSFAIRGVGGDDLECRTLIRVEVLSRMTWRKAGDGDDDGGDGDGDVAIVMLIVVVVECREILTSLLTLGGLVEEMVEVEEAEGVAEKQVMEDSLVARS
jgi:hypothetical protein